MQEGRFELVFPFRGLNDNEAHSDQPEGTTVEAVNVRPFDPKSGRRRGAQRPGTAEWSPAAATTSPVQSILAVPFSQERLQYRLLEEPTSEWTAVTPSQGVATAITTDKNGFVYIYDKDATIRKYNPDGTLLATLTNPTPGGDVRRIVVDEFNNVYAGISRSSSGMVQKWTFEDEDDGTYRTSWVLGTDRLRDIAIQNDMLYVASDSSSYLAEGGKSHVIVYAGLLSDYAPPKIWGKEVSHPLHAIDVKSSGVVYFTSPPNPTRGDVPGGEGSGTFAESVVDWNPTDIGNVNDRLHYWFDVSYLQDLGVNLDHEDRMSDYENGSVNDTPEYLIDSITTRSDYGTFASSDTTTRRMASAQKDERRYNGTGTALTRSAYRSGPQYLAQSWGQLPTLQFDGTYPLTGTSWSGGGSHSNLTQDRGNALVSSYNNYDSGDDTKVGQTGSLDDNRGPVPGKEAQAYIFAAVARVDPNSPDKSILLTMDDANRGGFDTNDFGISVLVNANYDGTTGSGATQSGKVCVYLTGAYFSEGSDDAETDWRTYDLPSYDAEGRMILTVTVNPGQRKSAIRINGRAVDSVTVQATGGNVQQGQMEGRGTSPCGSGSHGNRTNGGRLTLGGPTQGTVVVAGDTFLEVTATGQDDDVTVCNVAPHQHDGRPRWSGTCTYDPNASGGPGFSANTKWAYFSGDICEVLTVLANHDGGGVNDLTGGTGGDALVPIHDGNDSTVAGETCEYAASPRCNTNTATTADTSDVERIEGYLAHKWGISFLLPQTGTTATGGLVERHPFYATAPDGTGDPTIGYDDSEYTTGIMSKDGVVGKLSASGDGVWALNGGGIGYALKANKTDAVYTVGPVNLDAVNPTTGTQEDTVQARKIVDLGSSFSVNPDDGAWVYERVADADEVSSEEALRYPRIEVDSSGNLYWPLASAATTGHVKRLADADGTLDWEYSLDASAEALGVALPATTPTYPEDTVTGPEFVYVCSDNGEVGGTATLTLPQLHKLRQMLAEENLAEGATSRAIKILGVSGGDIYEVSRTGTSKVGNDVLVNNSPFATSVAAFGKGYFVDGVNYKKYIPPAVETDEGTVESWEATKGEIPPRAKLVTFWRGRMVLARDPEDPQDWHMSALGEPDNWDKDPAVYTATMAISGNNARCGKAPDIVNAIIPYSDDLLLFGGDSNIYRLTGDPMGGGQMDTVSTTTGIAYGEAWCKDPEGIVYFFGSRGGVYAMTPQGEIASLTSSSIERRLQQIDLRQAQIKLVWNPREQGLHVYQVPSVFTLYTVKPSWFWDKRNNAWFEDEIGAETHQVMAAAAIDGDEYDDRVLLLGTEFGKFLWYDPDSANDYDVGGGVKQINSRVVLGPLAHEEAMASYRYGKIKAELARGQSGLDYSIRVADQAAAYADSSEAPHGSGRFISGPNTYAPGTFKGASVWIKLSNAALGERWALEALSLTANPAGRKIVQ